MFHNQPYINCGIIPVKSCNFVSSLDLNVFKNLRNQLEHFTSNSFKTGDLYVKRLSLRQLLNGASQQLVRTITGLSPMGPAPCPQ